jgi:hypothetical protein
MIICKTIILTVLLYGCETWSLTLREEHRLRVFEGQVLRRTFGPKGDEVSVTPWPSSLHPVTILLYLFLLILVKKGKLVVIQ